MAGWQADAAAPPSLLHEIDIERTVNSLTETPPEPDHNAAPPSREPITLRDVLRAVFLPERAAPGQQTEPGEVLPRAQPAPAAAPSPPVRAPLTPANLAPASVTYPDVLPEPAAGASTGRAAVLVLGTAVSIFVAYLAQTTLAVQGRATAAVLLYALAGLSWLAL